MTEKLTWEEIQRRYPDEWVLIDEIDEGDAFPISAGRVAFHSKQRGDAEARLSAPPFSEIGIFFTGAMVEPDVAYIL